MRRFIRVASRDSVEEQKLKELVILKRVGRGDKFVSQGSVDELFYELKMDGESIADEILKEFF